MEKNLPVPYKSQWDIDATDTANDCGPTSIAMILNYYEGAHNYTSNQVFQKTGAGQGLIGFEQMAKAIKAFGYEYSIENNTTPERIKQLINEDTPPIALVHYGSLESTQDKRFKGGHFFVVVGYRSDGYFVNDPNFKDAYRSHGDHHFYTKAEFEKAWGDCYLDGNPNKTLIVIKRKQNQKASSGTDMYPANPPHLDQNNKESMKIATDVWVRLVKGELMETSVHEKQVDELNDKIRELTPKAEKYDEFARNGYPSFEYLEKTIKDKDLKIDSKEEDVKKLTREIGELKEKNKNLAEIIGKDEREDCSSVGVGYEAQKERDAIKQDLTKIKVLVGLSEAATTEALTEKINTLLLNRETIEKEVTQEYLYKRTKKLIDSFWMWLKLGIQVWQNKRGGAK